MNQTYSKTDSGSLCITDKGKSGECVAANPFSPHSSRSCYLNWKLDKCFIDVLIDEHLFQLVH